MKPHIFIHNERWTVAFLDKPILGFILKSSAYAYAKALWERRKGE